MNMKQIARDVEDFIPFFFFKNLFVLVLDEYHDRSFRDWKGTREDTIHKFSTIRSNYILLFFLPFDISRLVRWLKSLSFKWMEKEEEEEPLLGHPQGGWSIYRSKLATFLLSANRELNHRDAFKERLRLYTIFIFPFRFLVLSVSRNATRQEKILSRRNKQNSNKIILPTKDLNHDSFFPVGPASKL